MKNFYFLSDVHLAINKTREEAEKRGKLFQFFDFIKKDASELFLVGDFFDFWFEWYHVIPKYWFPVLFKLKELIESGIKITFITGNHDFFIGNYLKKDLGLHCYEEHTDFVVDSKKFFIGHGDGLAKKDSGYRLLKKIIRNPISIFLFKTFIPADIGVQIAKWTSSSSRKLKKINKSVWSLEYYKFAKEKFKKGFDYVVLGHIHYPMIREKNGKIYANCGDWMTYFTYCKYDGTTLSLHYWDKPKT